MRFNHFVKLSGALLLTTGLAGTASAQYNTSSQGYNAHEACKASENRSQIIGGGIGAVAGAVIGSQVAGNGARTEASVIGGVLGGLAGAGIADKRVDCDPVYSDGYQASSSRTYSGDTYSGGTYTSSPTYSTTSSSSYHQAASYPQVDYGTRTTVSDHPVYSNPTWGAQPARTYISQPVSQPVYSQPTYQSASYSQPQHRSSTTTHYTRPATTAYVQPTRTYVQPATTYVQPRTTYVRSAPVTHHRHRALRHGAHHHGRFACSDRH